MTRVLITAAAWLVAFLFLLLPFASLLTQALQGGIGAALAALSDPDAVAAFRLSAFVVAIAVPINAVAGFAAAYALTKFSFPGRRALVVLIELPLSISPVVSGLVWVLLFGRNGWFGPWLEAHGVQITFAFPGILLATLFVTFPFVARSVMPVMEAQGRDAEEAATMLGAGFLHVLTRVTIPGIVAPLLAGILLCAARALGEFGAVSVVSGHIPGVTETVPLRIETLYNDYDTVSAFALALALAVLSIVAVGLRGLIEWRREAASARMAPA
jgi:sulfate transport system permease protein